jgi:hypothetical protein
MGKHHPPDALQDKRTHYEICELFKWANEDDFWQKTFSAHQNYASSGISSRLNACAAMAHQETHQAPVRWTTQTGSTGYSNEIYRRKHAQLRP